MRDDAIDIYAPCRCGSGKKYKFCCLQKDREEKKKSTAVKWDSRQQPLEAGGRRIVYLDLEESERLNAEGLKLFGSQRFTEAELIFRAAIAAAPLAPAPHNNLALTAFAQGRIGQAIQIQKNILHKVRTGNVFGMGNLVQFYLTVGRTAEAKSIADTMLQLEARDCSAVGKKCEILARFRRHRDILDVVERCDGERDGAINYFAGIAAANLGLFDRALDYLQRIERRDMFGSRAAKCIGIIKSGRGPDTIEGEWSYFLAQDIVPREVFEKIINEAAASSSDRASTMNNPMIVDVLAASINEDRGGSRSAGLVELLGRMKHPRAVDLLKRIAEGTFGSDDFRLSALHALVANGAWDKGATHKMFLRGQWIDVKTQQPTITPEEESAPVPEGLDTLYEKATIAVRCGRLQEGERLWREFLAQAPEFHPACHNLAIALMRQGRNAEAEMYLRKALDLNPAYLFALCSLALICLKENRIAEARALLDGITIPDRVHPDAMAAYCSAQTQVAAVERNMKAAVAWLDIAVKIAPDNAAVKDLRKRLRIPRLIEKTFSRRREKGRKQKLQQRRRVLSQDAPLADCYGVYSTEELACMARAAGIDLAVSRSGNALAVVCAALGNSETVHAVLRGLRAEEAAALQKVADAGGRMDYDAFTRAHGTDVDDEPGWSIPPQSILGRLKCRGLLVEATVEHRPSVFIPAQIPMPKD
jgi:tetratricopeptide (TPR) repeat protein